MGIVKLKSSDCDLVLSLLRNNLIELNDRKKSIQEVKQSYENKSNPMIEDFVKSILPDEARLDFDKLTISRFDDDLKKTDSEIKQYEECILLLTAGSEGV